MRDDVEHMRFAGAGLDLAADAIGPADGLPLLFLHGAGQTRHSWGRALIEAARRGYRGVAIDLRGHGDSEWSADGGYGIERVADDVRAVVAALGRPPVLIGASMGGLAALLVAAWPPPPVAGLILVDVAARLEIDGAREIGAFMTAGANGFASLEDAADAVAAYLPHRPRPKDTSGLMRNLRLKEDGRLHWHYDPAFIRRDKDAPMPDWSLFEAAAARLAIPTRLIRGGRSRVVSQAGAQAFVDLVPQADLVDVADADHMVAGDANDRFNAAVFEFLDRRVLFTA